MEAKDVIDKIEANKSRKVFYYFLIGIAAVGLWFVASALLQHHQTGVVTRIGRISTTSHHVGVGKNAHDVKGWNAEVQVRAKDTGETVTVHYRVGRRESIPQEGDEIEFYNDLLVEYQPYPQMWAVKMGIALLGADLAVYTGFLIYNARKKRIGCSDHAGIETDH